MDVEGLKRLGELTEPLVPCLEAMGIIVEGGGSFNKFTVIGQKTEYGGILGNVYSAVNVIHESSLFASWEKRPFLCRHDNLAHAGSLA
jgi:hypothetical protein